MNPVFSSSIGIVSKDQVSEAIQSLQNQCEKFDQEYANQNAGRSLYDDVSPRLNHQKMLDSFFASRGLEKWEENSDCLKFAPNGMDFDCSIGWAGETFATALVRSVKDPEAAASLIKDPAAIRQVKQMAAEYLLDRPIDLFSYLRSSFFQKPPAPDLYASAKNHAQYLKNEGLVPPGNELWIRGGRTPNADSFEAWFCQLELNGRKLSRGTGMSKDHAHLAAASAELELLGSFKMWAVKWLKEIPLKDFRTIWGESINPYLGQVRALSQIVAEYLDRDDLLLIRFRREKKPADKEDEQKASALAPSKSST